VSLFRSFACPAEDKKKECLFLFLLKKKESRQVSTCIQRDMPLRMMEIRFFSFDENFLWVNMQGGQTEGRSWTLRRKRKKTGSEVARKKKD